MEERKPFPNEFKLDLTVGFYLNSRFYKGYSSAPGAYIEDEVRHIIHDSSDRLKYLEMKMEVYQYKDDLSISFEDGRREYKCEPYTYDEYKLDLDYCNDYLSQRDKVIRTLNFKRVPTTKDVNGKPLLKTVIKDILITPTPSSQTPSAQRTLNSSPFVLDLKALWKWIQA
jgi:hypothetical protein